MNPRDPPRLKDSHPLDHQTHPGSIPDTSHRLFLTATWTADIAGLGRTKMALESERVLRCGDSSRLRSGDSYIRWTAINWNPSAVHSQSPLCTNGTPAALQRQECC